MSQFTAEHSCVNNSGGGDSTRLLMVPISLDQHSARVHSGELSVSFTSDPPKAAYIVLRSAALDLKYTVLPMETAWNVSILYMYQVRDGYIG